MILKMPMDLSSAVFQGVLSICSGTLSLFFSMLLSSSSGNFVFLMGVH